GIDAVRAHDDQIHAVLDRVFDDLLRAMSVDQYSIDFQVIRYESLRELPHTLRCTVLQPLIKRPQFFELNMLDRLDDMQQDHFRSGLFGKFISSIDCSQRFLRQIHRDQNALKHKSLSNAEDCKCPAMPFTLAASILLKKRSLQEWQIVEKIRPWLGHFGGRI